MPLHRNFLKFLNKLKKYFDNKKGVLNIQIATQQQHFSLKLKRILTDKQIL